MINPPKSKEYYLAAESGKRKEAERINKDIYFENSKLSELKSALSKMQSNLRNIESSMRGYERDASHKSSLAASYESQASSLMTSPDPKDRAQAVRLNSMAKELRRQGSEASRRAGEERNKISNIRWEINMLNMKIGGQESMVNDLIAKSKRLLKEADEMHKASLKIK